MDQSNDDDDFIWMNYVEAVIGQNEADNDRSWWQNLWEMCVSISKVLPRRASFRYFSICGSADSASEDAFMKPVDADKLIISFFSPSGSGPPFLWFLTQPFSFVLIW